MYNQFRFLILRLWMCFPYGCMCRVTHGASSMTLRKDFWVEVSDGTVKNNLPLSRMSPYMQHAFALRMKEVGYDISKYFDDVDLSVNVKDSGAATSEPAIKIVQ